MRDIEVQYVADCPNLSVLLERLDAVTCGRVNIRLREVDPDARLPEGFAGSPTLLIDGHNPYGRADRGARVTFILHVPSVLELKAALDRASNAD